MTDVALDRVQSVSYVDNLSVVAILMDISHMPLPSFGLNPISPLFDSCSSFVVHPLPLRPLFPTFTTCLVF